MKKRNLFAVLILAIIVTVGSTLDLSAQFRRRDIYSYTGGSGGERHRLRQLIIQWLTTHPSNPIAQHLSVIGPLPTGVHCKTATFLTWHRQYIAQLETWLMSQQDGPKFVPLPKWDPTTQIPDEFFNGTISPGNAVVPTYDPLDQQDPNSLGGYSFSNFTNPGTICNFTAGNRTRYCMGPNVWFTSLGTALDNFARDLELEHNPVHGNINGVMGQGASPAAAIFWLWHAYVDDLYQYYLCSCTSGYPNKDLYIMDNNADIGDEPNTTAGTYYESPEIWVRQNADVQVGGRYTLEDNPNRHENAEYKTTGSNYVYVRVRNKGCQATTASEVRLRVYWSKAQTSGWVWPNDWTNTPPLLPKRGDEITNPSVALLVPALQPGQSWVAQVPWQAPNPADYPTDSYHFCLLARLVSTVDLMHSIEGTDVNYNTRENNNVAWKNVTVKNDDPFNIVGPGGHTWNTVHVRNLQADVHDVRLAFNFPDNHGVYATIDLRGDLYQKWLAGGARGYGIAREEGTYVRIDRPGAYIEGLNLDANKIYTLGVRTYMEYGRNYDGVVLNYGDHVDFNVTQYGRYGGNSEYTMTGGNNYEIRLTKSKQTECGKLISQVTVHPATCPNASDGSINLNLPNSWEYFWSNGEHGSSIQNLAPGTYWVVVRNPSNCIERREFVVNSVSNLGVEIDATGPRCNYPNGKAIAYASGGREPYTYQWYRDGEQLDYGTEPALNDIGFGLYTVDVTDSRGCTANATINLVDGFMQLGLAYDVTDASSDDATDGAIDLMVLDGMGPLTYQWSNGATTEDLDHLAPGDYSVVVIDHMGCVANATVTVGVATGKSLQSVEGEKSDLSILNVVPNPVTDLAEVQYTLRYSTNVKVEVYDEVGKLVTSYDQGVKAPGTNSAWLTTSSLPVGRYTCRLVYRRGVSAIPFVVVR